MEQLAVSTGLDIVDGAGLEIDVERPRHKLSATSLREESGKTTVVVLDACLKATVGLL